MPSLTLILERFLYTEPGKNVIGVGINTSREKVPEKSETLWVVIHTEKLLTQDAQKVVLTSIRRRPNVVDVV